MEAVPLLVVCALLLATGAEILPPDSLVSAGPVQLNLARLLILLGLVCLVATHAPRRELGATWLGIPLALLLLAGLVATLKWGGTEPRFRFLVESVALFYLVFGVVRTRPRARAALVAIALVAVALSALTGVAQVAQATETGFYRDGCEPLTAAPGEPIPPGAITRATGTFQNPNLLAAHVLLLAPLGAVAVVMAARALELRLGLGLAVGLAYLGLVFTYSRVATFAALAALAVALVTSRVERKWPLALVGLGLAVGSLFLFATCGSEAGAGFGRAEGWRQTVEVIEDNPVYGVGLGRLGDVLQAENAQSVQVHAHNLVLNWGAEAGVAAGVAWLALLALLLFFALRAALRGDRVARGALVALLGFLAVEAVDHPANVDRVATAFWILAGVIAALASVRRAPEADTVPAP